MRDKIVETLIAAVRLGKPRAIARLITLVENSEEAAKTAVFHLHPHTGRAHIIGITGSPGAGKSTLVNEIAKAARKQNDRVAIIAVDPTSPFTGGALLGDRVRMRELAGDKGVFIRSMASRGSLGGLSAAVTAVLTILDAANFDIILLETVGAGQAEVEIAAVAHTTLVVEAPGMGDDIQSIKAGILEIADILIVNKADRAGAARTTEQLRTMLRFGEQKAWPVPVLETIAVAPTAKTGVAQVMEKITAHHHHLQTTDEGAERAKTRIRWQVEQLLHRRLLKMSQRAEIEALWDGLITAVFHHQTDPYTAANQVFTKIIHEG